jgi:GTPase SAR1 family protein
MRVNLLTAKVDLETKVNNFFDAAISLLQNQPSLRQLQRFLEDEQRQLQKPMQVAIVGKIKAGKSTILNALLGESLVPTGSVEATFNVNWLKHTVDAPYIQVHYKDEKNDPERKSIKELENLTRRAEGSSERQKELLAIKHIEVYFPNPILETLDLIDTPGLSSDFKSDEKNTRDFLKLYGDELTQSTQTHTREAHAVLYLFKQTAGQTDLDVMTEFLGQEKEPSLPFNAFNAIGVLTRADEHWPQEAEPMQVTQRIASQLTEQQPDLNNIFYKIQPVSGLLAWGAQTLTSEEFRTLESLASLPQKRFDLLLKRSDSRFTKSYPEEPEIPSTDARKKIHARLGRYGIYLACEAIRTQRVSDPNTLAELLLQKSGFQELRNLVESHFGKRAFLIKVMDCVRRIEHCLFQAEHEQQESPALKIIQQVSELLDCLEHDEILFGMSRELEALRLHYRDRKIEFSPEEYNQFLEVMGERGQSCAARLGLPAQAVIPDMLEQAMERMEVWRLRSNDGKLEDNADTSYAADVVANAYERIYYQLSKAQRLVTSADYRSPEWQVLTQDLAQVSNVPELSSLAKDLRALLKTEPDSPDNLRNLEAILKAVEKICFYELQKPHRAERKQIEQLAARVETIFANDYRLRELQVWELFQAQHLDLDQSQQKQIQEILTPGKTVLSDRLGLPETALLTELINRAEERKIEWLTLANDSFWIDAQTLWAARVVAQSYESIQYRLIQAYKFLNPRKD